MDEIIDALEIEIAKIQNTIEVVRLLKPIQRQTDACLELLRKNVGDMAHVVAEQKAEAATGAPAAGEGEQQQAATA